MSKKTKEEPVARDLRDLYGILSSLKQHIERTYGKHNDWADEYVNHEKAILSLPKFKSVTDIISQMTPDLLRGKMKYAMGDYEKKKEPAPPPPPPAPVVEDDALTDFYRGLLKLGSMENRMKECAIVREQLKRAGKSPDDFARELKEETRRMARGKEAPATAHDMKADRAREAKASADTKALRERTTHPPGTRGPGLY